MAMVSATTMSFAQEKVVTPVDSVAIKRSIATEKEAFKFNLNADGSHFFQATFLNQAWFRYNQSNPGTTVENEAQENTFDIGLRRTRIQLFGQVTDRVFLYFQVGQNNFNSQTAIANNGSGNRKISFFIHDAVSDYKVFKDHNWLKVGGGLTIANGLSRFSQPSIGTIMTMDVPVFAQATVDQTDQFSRKLSMYVRGQINKFDYRFSLSDPFPIQSNGTTPSTPNATNAIFATKGHHLQQQAYLMYQFFEHEQHNTPYMTGTFLGKKKVFNIAAGLIHQSKATMTTEKIGNVTDTSYYDMTLWCIESFLDMPLNKEKGTALSAYAGFFNTNYGKGYLRYNGIMNPANGGSGTSTEKYVQASAYGNAVPMFGTGQVIYTQVGYLMKKDLLGVGNGTLMPYVSMTSSNYDALSNKVSNVYNVGLNWIMNGHKSKLSLDYQLRPTFYKDVNNNIQKGNNKSCVTLQWQVFI